MSEAKSIQVRTSDEPLYATVLARIRGLITNGDFKPGERLPSEAELARMLNVSRNTLREALRLAVREGLVRQKHGVGTFVLSRPIIEQGIEVLESLDSVCGRLGAAVGTAGMSIDREVPSDRIVQVLGLAEDAEVIRVSRARTVEGRPVAFMEDWFAAEIAPIEEVKATFPGSALDFFIARGHPRMSHSRASIRAQFPDAQLIKALDAKPDSILICMEETVFSTDGSPFEYSLNYFLAEWFLFQVVRTLPEDTRGASSLRRLVPNMSDRLDGGRGQD